MMDRSTDKNTEKRKENKKTYRGRLVAAFVVVLVTTLLEIIYYGYHIMDNRDNVVHSFKNEQDSTAQIIADGLAGKSEDAMIHFIRHSVPVSGTTWGFILKDGRVLYMKDDDTTKNLENISSKAEFELYMEDLGGIVSEASVSGTEYVCGVFTDKDYVLEEYGTSNMEFYIVTAVIATILVFGCILIEFAGRIGHEGRKVIALQSDLTERNEKFDEYERLTDQYEEELRNRDFDKTDLESNEAELQTIIDQKQEEITRYDGDIEAQKSLMNKFTVAREEAERRIAEISRQEMGKANANGTGAYTKDGKVYDTSKYKGKFMWPVSTGGVITDEFGYRDAPTAGASTYHQGLDIGCDYGTDIVAAEAGTVVMSCYNGGGGNMVMISHGGGICTVYMHNSQLCVNVGDKVVKGQVIAKAGSTGVSTGPHCHFGVSIDGTYVNPHDFLGQ